MPDDAGTLDDDDEDEDPDADADKEEEEAMAPATVMSPHSSQMQIMRSSEQDAKTCPNSGCAQLKRHTLFWCGARGKSYHDQCFVSSSKSHMRILSLEHEQKRLP